MPVAIAPPEVETAVRQEDLLPGPGGPGDGSGGASRSGRRGGDSGRGPRPDTYRLGMWLGLASIGMMFIGFSSAYIFGRGTQTLWQTIQAPPFLWINTMMLLASSVTLELARRARGSAELKRWLTWTCLLGSAFLAGQLWVWKVLAAQGIYLSGNPHSSFFYLLTGVHGLHLLGGVAALVYLTVRTWLSVTASPEKSSLDVTALYWHFMDGLWIYLLVLLFLWR